MIVNSSRFGEVEVREDRVITFSRGLLGFARCQRYVLIQPPEGGCLFWLQSVEDEGLAFVVTDPHLFVRDYRVPIKPDQLEEMDISSPREAQVFVTVNRRGELLTGNLQGPLIINPHRRTGVQLVLSDRRFHTRTPLLDLNAPVSASA